MPELSDFTVPIRDLMTQAERVDNELRAFLNMQDAMPRPYRSDYELEHLRDAAQLLDDITDSYLDGLKKAQGIPLWGTPVTVGARRGVVVSCSISHGDPTRYDPAGVRVRFAKADGIIPIESHATEALTIAGDRLLTYDEQINWLNG